VTKYRDNVTEALAIQPLRLQGCSNKISCQSSTAETNTDLLYSRITVSFGYYNYAVVT